MNDPVFELAGRRVRERQRNDMGALAAQYGGQLVDENGDELELWSQPIARRHPPGAAP